MGQIGVAAAAQTHGVPTGGAAQDAGGRKQDENWPNHELVANS